MNTQYGFSANLVRRNLMRTSEAKFESSESNFLNNDIFLVTMRLRETPVNIPNTMVKT